MIRMAVVGAGYWGPNLIRNFMMCPTTELVAVCDLDAGRLQKVLSQYPGVQPMTSFDELLARPDIDALAIATPVRFHGPMGIAALEAGKHVLLEKPMAGSVRDAEEMVRIAEAKHLTLMVDHTFVYSPPVRKIKDLIDSGEIGELFYIDSVRINLGLFQHDVNVVWDLAPHDLSILDYLVGRLPKSISAFGSCHTESSKEIEDVAHLNLDFGGGFMASFHVNWLSPVKIRQFLIGGSKKGIVYNDLEVAEKVKVYDRGITVTASDDTRRDLMIGYRSGDVWSPHIEQQEPLQNMVRHFAHCIETQSIPLTGGATGLRVVQILEAAQRSIKAQGGRITF
ncbi:MAG: Gfo/Idh/MocA family protein [Planctomycetaceae bacterium]